jgi:hypothetical protein
MDHIIPADILRKIAEARKAKVSEALSKAQSELNYIISTFKVEIEKQAEELISNPFKSYIKLPISQYALECKNNSSFNDELRKIYNHHFKHELQIEGNNYVVLITSVHFGEHNKDVRPKNLNVEPEEDDQFSFSETEKKNFDKRDELRSAERELALTTPRLEKKPSITNEVPSGFASTSRTSSRIPNLQLLSLTRRNSKLSMPIISGRKNEVSEAN